MQSNLSVGLIGNGWVSKAMQKLFPKAYVYTRKIGKLEKLNKAEIIFICVPSPLKNGKLDTSIVEHYISLLSPKLFVVRSTVNPKDCDNWTTKYSKKIVFQPEFLGETPNHPMLDPKTRQWLIIGGSPHDRRMLIDLYTTVYNSNITIRQVTNYEAEVIKLTENRAIGFKIMQLHELYKVCEQAGLDYYTIRDAVYGDDPRFSLWFSFIYPNKLGFHNSKCLGKDVLAWCSWAEFIGFDPEITKLLVKKSKEYGENA